MEQSEVAARLGISPKPASILRFADGASFRIEIPSVEGPQVMAAVLEEADHLGVVVNRVSQGSGAMLLSGAELDEMAAMGRDSSIEVCLFVGPRAGFDTGVLPHTDSAHYAAIRGLRQLGHAVTDVVRAAEHGIRSFLVADIGLLSLLSNLQADGDLPEDCQWKVSAYFGVFNPATVAILSELGASTVNVPADLSSGDLADLRATVDLPLDIYIEAPDGMGGTIRIAELADLVQVAAPMHVKFGLRNGPSVYPSGHHLANIAMLAAREKVHRAAIALEWMERSGTSATQSLPHPRPGVPR